LIQQWAADVPISGRYGDFLLPKLAAGAAGCLQFSQATPAADFARSNKAQRLGLPDGRQRTVFVRTADSPFDPNGRLLAYLAPNFSKAELFTLTPEQRSTFNLDMVRAGWAAPFIIYPSIHSGLDLPLFLSTADNAVTAKRGESATLLAYEYRSVERLHAIAKTIIVEKNLSPILGGGVRDTVSTCEPGCCSARKTTSGSTRFSDFGYGQPTGGMRSASST
jgi:hypothetical protein